MLAPKLAPNQRLLARQRQDEDRDLIYASEPWKKCLLADAELLERWSSKPATSMRRSVLLERKTFLAAYAIRKLDEANKLSSSFRGQSITCRYHLPTKTQITRLNNHKIHKNYDLSSSTKKRISCRRLLDLIIHSFVFCEVLGDDNSIEGFFVTSDTSRYKGLWSVPMIRYIEMMRRVGNDYPSSMIMMFDPEQNDYYTWSGHGTPPKHIIQKMKKLDPVRRSN